VTQAVSARSFADSSLLATLPQLSAMPTHPFLPPARCTPTSPRNVLVEEMAARELPCGLHGVPANGAVIVIDCQLLRGCNCKSTKRRKEETEVTITPAQHGVLSREFHTEETLTSTLTFPWERFASKFALFFCNSDSHCKGRLTHPSHAFSQAHFFAHLHIHPKCKKL